MSKETLFFGATKSPQCRGVAIRTRNCLDRSVSYWIAVHDPQTCYKSQMSPPPPPTCLLFSKGGSAAGLVSLLISPSEEACCTCC